MLLRTSLLLAVALGGCSSTPCPGLPDEIPVDRGVAVDGPDWDAFDAFVQDEMARACVPALGVSLVDADGLVYEAAYGWAELETEMPITVDTPFMLASASKMTAGLALVLAEAEGDLSLSDPVSRHMPFEVTNPRLGARAPTIRLSHLATHSSGILDDWDVLDPLYVDGDSPHALGPFLRGYLTKGGRWFSASGNFGRWPAGDVWMYSNVGAALAAEAVANAVDEPYDAWTTRRLFEPLGMTRTRWFLADYGADDVVARPYMVDEDGRWEPVEHYGFPTYPDGQLRSTAGEYGRILSLVLADGRWDGAKVLPAAAVRRLLEAPHPHLSRWYLDAVLTDQLVFWFEMDLGGRRIIGHDGDDLGVSSEVFLDPEAEVGVAVVMNIPDGMFDGKPRAATMAIQERLYQLGEAR